MKLGVGAAVARDHVHAVHVPVGDDRGQIAVAEQRSADLRRARDHAAKEVADLPGIGAIDGAVRERPGDIGGDRFGRLDQVANVGLDGIETVVGGVVDQLEGVAPGADEAEIEDAGHGDRDQPAEADHQHRRDRQAVARRRLAHAELLAARQPGGGRRGVRRLCHASHLDLPRKESAARAPAPVYRWGSPGRRQRPFAAPVTGPGRSGSPAGSGATAARRRETRCCRRSRAAVRVRSPRRCSD